MNRRDFLAASAALPLMRYLRPEVIASSDYGSATGEEGGGDNSPTISAVLAKGGTGFCLGNSIAATLETRRRGGVASLCGYDTFIPINPGPQKKFRKKVSAGGFRYCYSNNPLPNPCIGPNNGSSGVDYGSEGCTINVATCAETNDQTDVFYDGDNNPCGNYVPEAPVPAGCGTNGADCGHAVTLGVLVKTVLGTFPTCCFDVPSGIYRTTSGSATETLSNEDTELDAIARLLAGAPWSGYAPCAAAGCATANYQARASASGFSFEYDETQYHITASGLTPGRAVCGQVDVYRALYPSTGVGAYVLFGQIQAVGTVDGAGNLSLAGTVPNDRGTSTYVTNPVIFPALF